MSAGLGSKTTALTLPPVPCFQGAEHAVGVRLAHGKNAGHAISVLVQHVGRLVESRFGRGAGILIGRNHLDLRILLGQRFEKPLFALLGAFAAGVVPQQNHARAAVAALSGSQRRQITRMTNRPATVETCKSSSWHGIVQSQRSY